MTVERERHKPKKTALVIGAGPAGLMAADVLAQAGCAVTICDAKPSFGRKFLMAGKSGLNLTKDEPLDQFLDHFCEAAQPLTDIVSAFDPQSVKKWAVGLGQEIFTGSTGRVFPKAMKASPLLRAWLERLDVLGVTRLTRHKWLGWEGADAVFEVAGGRRTLTADVTILSLGGASWSRLGSDGLWVEAVRKTGAEVAPFAPSNAALSVAWSAHMTPHLGSALKAVAWRAGDLASRGEATVSARGLEGGGIYSLTPALRAGAPLCVDLIPDIPSDRAEAALAHKPAKLRLTHWLKNTLRLSPVKSAIFFEMTLGNLPPRLEWVERVKNLPIHHQGLRPIDEAISTAGGVCFDSLTKDLMLKSRPGVFCAGEMIDSEAPTGGYLITACLATGHWAARGALRYLAAAA